MKGGSTSHQGSQCGQNEHRGTSTRSRRAAGSCNADALGSGLGGLHGVFAAWARKSHEVDPSANVDNPHLILGQTGKSPHFNAHTWDCGVLARRTPPLLRNEVNLTATSTNPLALYIFGSSVPARKEAKRRHSERPKWKPPVWYSEKGHPRRDAIHFHKYFRELIFKAEDH